MTLREAIRILILSPFYFRLNTVQRWQLVCEYRNSMRAISERIEQC